MSFFFNFIIFLFQVTTCDVIERALKKGKGAEIEAGARLAVLLSLQVRILTSDWSRQIT